jgi:Ig-like domain from next to BRCA1 gene
MFLDRKRRRVWGVLVIFSFFLGACRGAAQSPTPTGLDPALVLTAAAQTAQAILTAQAASTPTALPATPTPTQTPLQGTVSPTNPVSPTLNLTTLPVSGGTDKAEFVLDVTVPDGTVFKPGDTFVKTWRLKNAGTSTWTPAFFLVYVSGTQMGSAAPLPLQNNVPPGQTVDLSVSLTAPTATGNYVGYYMLRNPNQHNFGLAPNGETPFYVYITVSGGGGTAAPTTSPVAGGKFVTSANLSVDNQNFEGACPHTFNFIATFSLSKPATVSYRLEAETGFPITLPPPFTGGLDAGGYTLNYSLEFTNDMQGTARLHITAPEDVYSNAVSFSLKCK